MTFASIIAKYVDKPFCDGGKTEQGYGCLNLIALIAEELGYSMPREFHGLTEDNYYLFYKDNKREAERLLVKYLSKVGKKVKNGNVVAGDILLMSQAGKYFFPAMYTGNGNAITSTSEDGVRVFSVHPPNEIVFARRIR